MSTFHYQLHSSRNPRSHPDTIGRALRLRFLDQLDQSSTVIIRVAEQDEQKTRAILRQYRDKGFSFTDATSFAVMERLKITAAFTFDRNFAQYGFPVLAPL